MQLTNAFEFEAAQPVAEVTGTVQLMVAPGQTFANRFRGNIPPGAGPAGFIEFAANRQVTLEAGEQTRLIMIQKVINAGTLFGCTHYGRRKNRFANRVSRAISTQGIKGQRSGSTRQPIFA
jgi:hypothetical protein